MTIYGTVLPGAGIIARSLFLAGNLSAKAKGRLKILDWLRARGGNVSLAARHFGIDRETIRVWRDCLAKDGPRGLEDRSKRPRKVRQPTTSPDIVAGVVKLRRRYPAWSKYKIVPLLPNDLKTSASTIGRILRRRNLINHKISRKRWKAAKHPRARFPRGMRISAPGDMAQMDVKHVMLPGGKRYYQFTAIDVLTKQRILGLYRSESSRSGKDFLLRCLREFDFGIKAVQTDNGSAFLGEFEACCRELGLLHYFIHPRSPKQNSYVEISHGADEREFYQQGNVRIDFAIMEAKLKEWQRIWNEVRPHQALDYLTPRAYYEKWQRGRLPTRDVINLQT